MKKGSGIKRRYSKQSCTDEERDHVIRKYKNESKRS